MADKPKQSGGDLLEGLQQKPARHARPAPKKDFKPWHKPRKQWVRENQWAAEVDGLIKVLGLGGAASRPLSYLSLPGSDMLDVRVMQQVCARADVSLDFLGFMEKQSGAAGAGAVTDLNISLEEVRKLSNVDPESTVLLDRLQKVAEDDSVARTRTESAAPFDVINIDLCASVGQAPPLEQLKGYYDALARIVTLQAGARSPRDPWLLFLTTRTDFGTVNPDARERFLSVLAKLSGTDPKARKALEDAGLDHAAIDALRKGDRTDVLGFQAAFAIAVGQWLSDLARNADPSGQMALLRTSCVYAVHAPGHRNMMSFGFLCRTAHGLTQDPAGLASPAAVREPMVASRMEASEMISAMLQLQHVDFVLDSERKYDAMAKQASELMRLARYDPDEYLDWTKRQAERPPSSWQQPASAPSRS